MTTAIADILADLREQLFDETSPYRWSDATLFRTIKEAQTQVVKFAPNAIIEVKNFKCAAGFSQVITDHLILGIIRNKGIDGTANGLPVKVIDRNILDVLIPDWQSATAVTGIKYVAVDKDDGRNFYVYPPQPSVNPGYLELKVSAYPSTPTSDGNMSTEPIHDAAVVNYCLHKLLRKEDPAKAAACYQEFIISMGGKVA